jgi:Ca-activated chloride channel homolog
VSFGNPGLLWLAVALPLAVGGGVWAWAVRRRRAARALGSAPLLERLGAGDLGRFPRRRLVLLCLGALALGLAAAGPRWGLESVQETGVAADLVLALDVSRSMLAADVAPDRLEQQRALARRILRDLPGDRIGLVVFAGRPFTLSPITGDRSALHLHLDALDPDVVSHGGSALGLAVRQAAELARGIDDGRRPVVVLVSDGEPTDERDAVVTAADRAARQGVTIHTVGVGTPQGAPVPARPGPDGRSAGYTRGPDGEVYVSRLDEALLRDIASRTGGRYFRLGDPGASDALLRELRGLERAEGDLYAGVRPRPRHAWFILAALLFLAADGMVDGRRRRETTHA